MSRLLHRELALKSGKITPISSSYRNLLQITLSVKGGAGCVDWVAVEKVVHPRAGTVPRPVPNV